VLVTDFDKAVIAEVTAVTDGGSDWTLSLSRAPSGCGATFTFEKLATVLRAQVAEFTISDAGEVPILMMDPDGAGPAEPEAVAEAIEDLQIAIGVDQGVAPTFETDGQVGDDVAAAGDDDEWIYNHPDDSDPQAAVEAVPYRALRLTVTARSIGETTSVPTSIRPPAEDREGGTEADVFRRRSLSTTVEIRNLRGSPL
jgi:hypothetical protein